MKTKIYKDGLEKVTPTRQGKIGRKYNALKSELRNKNVPITVYVSKDVKKEIIKRSKGSTRSKLVNAILAEALCVSVCLAMGLIMGGAFAASV